MPADLIDEEPVVKQGEPPQAARLLAPNARGHARRLLADRVARKVVTFGGATIIFCILAILIVIAAQVAPLFRKPSYEPEPPAVTGIAEALRVGIDEYREIAYAVAPNGITFFSLRADVTLAQPEPLELGNTTVIRASQESGSAFALGLSDGRILPVNVDFSVDYADKKRTLKAEVEAGEYLDTGLSRPLDLFSFVESEDGPVAAVRTGPRSLLLLSVHVTESLIGGSTRETASASLDIVTQGEIASMTMDRRGEDLLIGTSRGELVRVDIRDRAAPRVAGTPTLTSSDKGNAITAMQFLLGDRTLIVGDEAGRVTSWQLLRGDDNAMRLVHVNTFAPHSAPVLACIPSSRDKGFVTMAGDGTVHLKYGTTGRTLLTMKAGAEPLRAVTFAPKADGILALDAAGALHGWRIDNRHPEITWRTLFGKVWYEGYDEPEFVWQSTGGTDDFEAKFSLTPLIYGTLKGTVYALLFAVPLALLGALYVSQFMHPDLRARIKPVVEIMAALPSVVLGFIAGLWLAPYMERIVPGIFIMPFVMAFTILLTLIIWRAMPTSVRIRIKPGYEILLLVPVVLAGGWLALRLGFVIEHAFLGGDYRTWLLREWDMTFDQRNSLVVGFAMGFAIIPIIFTIAEDSLSSVPNHLRAASLALGATPWQTAIHVILPTASPGIFSAVMIGFGRAVGETMIVLMATGNTPVMNMSIFSGFRALSANIAVELPEAPEGGTLFRVLFLAALLLFLLTFVVNTAAELIRLRLRKRYRVL